MSAPFSHEELEVKRNFLALARDLLDGTIEKEDEAKKEIAFELSAALLYMNVADYLAEYLVKGIVALVQNAVDGYYFSVIQVKPSKVDRYHIGESMKALEKYEFPGKSGILSKLTEVNKARKKVAHEILKTKVEDLESIDEAVKDLARNTEELINLVDNMQLGMPPRNLHDLIADAIKPGNEASKESKASKK